MHDKAACSVGSADGGKYLMYPYSVSGYDPNNHVSRTSDVYYVETIAHYRRLNVLTMLKIST